MTQRFRPIVQPRVSRRVAEQLKQAITSGRLSAGEKLPSEINLANEFRVSRTAIHEALRLLEDSGFIVIRPSGKGGSYVNDLNWEPSLKAFRNLFISGKISSAEIEHVRCIIESEAVRLAAQKMTSGYEKLQADHRRDEQDPAVTPSDEIRFRKAASPIVTEMSGNRLLDVLIRTLTALVEIANEHETLHAKTSGLPEADLADGHKSIPEAVTTGDGEWPPLLRGNM